MLPVVGEFLACESEMKRASNVTPLVVELTSELAVKTTPRERDECQLDRHVTEEADIHDDASADEPPTLKTIHKGYRPVASIDKDTETRGSPKFDEPPARINRSKLKACEREEDETTEKITDDEPNKAEECATRQ